MSTRKILFLLYNYPPEFGTASKRNASIVAHLKSFFNAYFVVTQSKSKQLNEAQLISFRSPDYRSFFRKNTQSGLLKEKYKQNFFSSFIIKLINTFPFNLIAGEGGGIYLMRIFFFSAKLVKTENITHIYSSYRPITDHFCAYLLKKRFPQLIWIADFRDLVVEPIYRIQYFPKLHEKLYKYIFRSADVVTSISAQYCQNLKYYNSSVIPVMNGIDPDWKVKDPVNCPQFTMVYTGSMYRSERNVEPLFKAIADLIHSGQMDEAKIRIRYAGKDGSVWHSLAAQYNLLPVFKDAGLISGDDAELLQSKSNINIMLTIASDEVKGVLTGKLIEYLMAGRPVLCIVKNQNDSDIEDILTDTNAGISISDQDKDLDKIKTFLLKYYSEWLKTGMNTVVINPEKLLKRFSNDAVFKELISRLELS